MASSLGIAPLLRPVESLNKKWLERDPLVFIMFTDFLPFILG